MPLLWVFVGREVSQSWFTMAKYGCARKMGIYENAPGIQECEI